MISSKKPLRSRKASQAPRSSLRLECLEPRLALAVLGGNVDAHLVGSTLLLTGDVRDNALVVSTAAGGRMAVFGGLGTTINGAETTVTPFVTSRAVTTIVATLDGGNDVIGLSNNSAGLFRQLGISGIPLPPFDEVSLQAAIDTVAGGTTTFSLPGSLTVTTGAGDDAVCILGTVAGSVAANLGSAFSSRGNSIAIGDPLLATLSSHVGGSFSVVGGAGKDQLFVVGTGIGGGVAVALGNGPNETYVSGTDTLDAATIRSFAYTGGTGDDEVSLGLRLTVRNDVSVYTGPLGADRIGVFGGVNVGGSVIVNTGAGGVPDSVRLMPATIKRDLSVTTGAGNDEIEVQWSEIRGGAMLRSGAGDDRISFTFGSVGLNAVINAGTGSDNVLCRNLRVLSSLSVHLAGGNDGFVVNDVSALAAFLFGGTGTNALTANAATRTGIRTLRWFQFQTVINA